MLKKAVNLLVLLPLAVLLVVFAVANRGPVVVSLDPFGGDTPALGLEMPVFVLIFLSLILGVVVGGTATWLGQGKWRRRAREEHYAAARLKAEADRREREQAASRGSSLVAAPGRGSS